MPKLKTNKSAAKRFRVTKNGKLKHSRAGRGHLLSGKSRKRKRQLRKRKIATPADSARLQRLLGLMG